MNLRSSVNHKTNDLIILECERGEKNALKNYQNVCKVRSSGNPQVFDPESISDDSTYSWPDQSNGR